MMLFHHHIWLLALTLGTGMFAGFVDTLSGGGGLITMPVLLLFGLPPATVLGTNKLQGTIGELSSTLYYIKGNHLKAQEIIWGIFTVIIGAGIGAIAVCLLHPTHLNTIISILLVIVFVYLVLPHRITQRSTALLNHKGFYLIFGLIIGFYNGFFGPNTGAFWITAMMLFLAMDLNKAIIQSKPLNLTGDIIALIIFACLGKVNYLIGCFMGAGQIIGATTGARFVVSDKKRFIRPIFLTIIGILVLHNIWRMLF